MILTSFACAAAVGVVAVLETVLAPAGGPTLPALWWCAYALLLLSLLVMHDYVPRPRSLPVNAMLSLLIGLSVLLCLLFPAQAWMAVLLVLSATTASFYWASRQVTILVICQSAIVAAMGLLGGWSTVDVVMSVLAFGNIQAFAALVVFTARGEAEARRELSVAHAELRATIALLEWKTKDAERLRISRDLHDLAGHDLTALSLELEVSSHLLDDHPAAVHVGRARSIAKGILATVRSAVGEMRSRPLNLTKALRDIAAGLPQLAVTVEVDHRAALPDEHTVIALRCVQEALTNTLRHSTARSVNIDIRAADGGHVVTVTDDGGGAEHMVTGNGLNGMRERFEAVGGDVQFRSTPGQGFTIIGRLPPAG